MFELSNYQSALERKHHIEAMVKLTSEELRAISGGGAMGLTPDSVKQSPEFRAKQTCYTYWHNTQRQFNAEFLRRYGREYRADRARRRNA